MRGLRRARPADPVREHEAALLAALGATETLPADGAGFWVYGLRDGAGETFYVGKSASIWTRLGAHRRRFGATLCSVWLVRRASEWSMVVTEDFLIDELQPRLNVHGMADEEERVRDRTLAKARRRSARTAAVHTALREHEAVSGEQVAG